MDNKFKDKSVVSGAVRPLTESEKESLRQEMQQAGQWMKAELAKRRRQLKSKKL